MTGLPVGAWAGEPDTRGEMLLRELGYEVVGAALGYAVEEVPVGVFGTRPIGEQVVLTRARQNTFDHALRSLLADARAQGGALVTGIDVNTRRATWASSVISCTMTGTVTRSVSRRPPGARLSSTCWRGADLWALAAAGFGPARLVVASAVWSTGTRSPTAMAGRPKELTRPTQALYAAREVVMSRLQAQALEAAAVGVVDVRLLEVVDEWGPHTIELGAMGTAVHRLPDTAQIPSPGITIRV